jgi:hypothetical protein
LTYILDNIVAILAATLAGLAFGFVWYRTIGRTPDARPLTPGFGAVAFVAEFWLASILAGALILAPPQAGVWVMTLATPVVIWIGFLVPAFAVSFARRGFPSGAIAREVAHWLGVMLVQAAVLRLVGLVQPPV